MTDDNTTPSSDDILEPNSGYWDTYDNEQYTEETEVDEDAETEETEETEVDEPEVEEEGEVEEVKEEEKELPEDVVQVSADVALNKESDRVVRFKENGAPTEATIGELVDAYQQTLFSRREATKAKQVIFDFEAIKQDFNADPFDFMERAFNDYGGEQYVVNAALNYLNDKQKVLKMNDYERAQYARQRDDVRSARKIQIDNQRAQLEQQHKTQEEHKEFFKVALRDASNEVGLKLTDDTKQLVHQLIAADINQHRESIQQRGGNPDLEDGYRPDVLRAMRIARRMIEDENPTHPAVIQKIEQQERQKLADMKKKPAPAKAKPKVPQKTQVKTKRPRGLNLQQLAEQWGLE